MKTMNSTIPTLKKDGYSWDLPVLDRRFEVRAALNEINNAPSKAKQIEVIGKMIDRSENPIQKEFFEKELKRINEVQ